MNGGEIDAIAASGQGIDDINGSHADLADARHLGSTEANRYECKPTNDIGLTAFSVPLRLKPQDEGEISLFCLMLHTHEKPYTNKRMRSDFRARYGTE